MKVIFHCSPVGANRLLQEILMESYEPSERASRECDCPSCGTNFGLYNYADGQRWVSTTGKQYDADRFYFPVDSKRRFCINCCPSGITSSPELMYDFLHDNDALDDLVAEYFGLGNSIYSNYEHCSQFAKTMAEVQEPDMVEAMKTVIGNYKSDDIREYIFGK